LTTATGGTVTQTGGRLLKKLAGSRRLVMAAILVVVGVTAAACANGTYPLDFFYEMHYAQSYGAHEPPRLSPPEGAVPITGRGSATTENPIAGTRFDEGAQLFVTNCVICHGPAGRGDGKVLVTMQQKYGYETLSALGLSSDLTSSAAVGHAQSLDDKGVFDWITNGTGFVMPSFAKLLSVEERWLLTNYIHGCLGDMGLPDCPAR